MSNKYKLYVVDWKNGFVGFFEDSTLEQIANVRADEMNGLDMLKELKMFAGNKELVLNFLLEGHEDLNVLRKARGIEVKPLLF